MLLIDGAIGVLKFRTLILVTLILTSFVLVCQSPLLAANNPEKGNKPSFKQAQKQYRRARLLDPSKRIPGLEIKRDQNDLIEEVVYLRKQSRKLERLIELKAELKEAKKLSNIARVKLEKLKNRSSEDPSFTLEALPASTLQQEVIEKLKRAKAAQSLLKQQQTVLIDEVIRLRKLAERSDVGTAVKSTIDSAVSQPRNEALSDTEDQLRHLKLALSKQTERAESLETELESLQQESRGVEVSSALQEELEKELQFQVARADKLERAKKDLEGKVKALRRFSIQRRKMSNKILEKEAETYNLKNELEEHNRLKKENVILRDEIYSQKKYLDSLKNAASSYLSDENKTNRPKLEDREFAAPSKDKPIENKELQSEIDIKVLERRKMLVKKLEASFAEDRLKKKSKAGTEVFSQKGLRSQLDF
jgi:hypothetical protein